MVTRQYGSIERDDQVLTLHDLSPLEHPEWFTPAFSTWYRLFTPILARLVRTVVVSSEYMKRKIMLRFALPTQRVSVVPGGVDISRFRPDLNLPEGFPAHYLLYVGTLQPRKNLPVLLRAWNQISHQFPTPATARRRHRSNFIGVFTCLDLRLGYVDTDLARLYAGAQSVLPSKKVLDCCLEAWHAVPSSQQTLAPCLKW
jgi:glycosyltransferase involved in cell wall biosynthesis